jgi:hypothetical protein
VPGHRILEYAESHPAEVLAGMEDQTEALIRDLERRERGARRALKRPVSRDVYPDVPF